MTVRRSIAALVAVAILPTLAACGDSGDDSSAAGDSGGGAVKITASKTLGETQGPAGEKATPTSDLQLTDEEIQKLKSGNHTVALVWHQASDFVTAVSGGAKDRLEELGIDVVAETNANFDAAKQKSDVETVLAKKPDVLLTLPVDPVATKTAYAEANRKGTKIVLLSNVPQGFQHGKDYVSLLTDDLFQMGKQAADALAAHLGGKGKIAYFFHDAEYYVTNQRDQAFKQTIEQNHPDIEIVAEQGIADPNKAEEQASAILTQNPGLDGAYVTFSQPPAEGVLSALRNAGNTDAKLVSLDLDEPLAVDMARDGNVAALISDKAHELGAAMATAAAYGILGKEAPAFVVAPAITVTKDTIEQGYRESLGADAPTAVKDALR